MELQIEKEENEKAMGLLRELRERERSELRAAVERVKAESTKQTEEVKKSLEFGLEAAPSVIDRNISLFSRGHQPAFAGINTFMKAPYCEDIRKIGDYQATIPLVVQKNLAIRKRFPTAVAIAF